MGNLYPLGLASAAAVLAAGAGCATDDGATPAPAVVAAAAAAPADVDRSRLAWIEARGGEIYERDRAAWVATDAAVAEMDIYASDVQGWISVPADAGWKTIFLKPSGDGYAPVFTAWSSEREVTRTEIADEDAGPVSEAVASAFRARQTAARSGVGYCSDRANSVVIPVGDPERPDGFDVYLFSATLDAGVLVAGGHHRVRVGPDGEEVLETQPFSKSCLVLDKIGPDGQPTAGLFVTHLLAETPEETHVFFNLSHDIPIFVSTTSNEALWAVEDGSISLVEVEGQ